MCEKVSRAHFAPSVCQVEGHLSGKIAHLTCLYTGNGGKNAHYWLARQTKLEMKPYARMFFTSNLLILLQIVALCVGKTTSRLPERFNSGNFLAHPHLMGSLTREKGEGTIGIIHYGHQVRKNPKHPVFICYKHYNLTHNQHSGFIWKQTNAIVKFLNRIR